VFLCQVNKLKRELEKEEQITPKVRIRMEIIKLSMEISKTENKKIIEKNK
jgi:hypothetical protein